MEKDQHSEENKRSCAHLMKRPTFWRKQTQLRSLDGVVMASAACTLQLNFIQIKAQHNHYFLDIFFTILVLFYQKAIVLMNTYSIVFNTKVEETFGFKIVLAIQNREICALNFLFSALKCSQPIRINFFVMNIITSEIMSFTKFHNRVAIDQTIWSSIAKYTIVYNGNWTA